MSLRSKFKHSKVFILWFLNTDKLVEKTRLHLIFSTCLPVFRNQRKNTFSCLNIAWSISQFCLIFHLAIILIYYRWRVEKRLKRYIEKWKEMLLCINMICARYVFYNVVLRKRDGQIDPVNPFPPEALPWQVKLSGARQSKITRAGFGRSRRERVNITPLLIGCRALTRISGDQSDLAFQIFGFCKEKVACSIKLWREVRRALKNLEIIFDNHYSRFFWQAQRRCEFESEAKRKVSIIYLINYFLLN